MCPDPAPGGSRDANSPGADYERAKQHGPHLIPAAGRAFNCDPCADAHNRLTRAGPVSVVGPAIHLDGLARRVGRIRPAEHGDNVGDLLGPPVAPHWIGGCRR